MSAICKRSRVAEIVTAACWAYPAMLVGSLYLTWLLGWVILGHAPRPSLDDPKDISDWLTVPYYFTGLLTLGFPLALFGGLIATAWLGERRQWSLPRRLLLVAILAGVWALEIAFLRWDPLRVGQWFMD